jgi:lysozyme
MLPRLLCLFVFLLPRIMGNGTPSELTPRTAGTVYGVDVSHYQGQIDWDSVAHCKEVSFAFIKATEAHDYTDSTFCHNWETLHKVGIRRGAYHFFRAYGCGEDQARHFLSVVDFRPGDLAPVLDIERADGIPPEIVREEAAIWLRTVESHLQIRPIIYSSQNFYENFLAGHFDQYPLWVAKYSAEPPVVSRRWDVWQFSNNGRISGIPTAVDMNMLCGGTQLLEQLCWYPAPAAPAVVLP